MRGGRRQVTNWGLGLVVVIPVLVVSSSFPGSPSPGPISDVLEAPGQR
jgi:hypothetical protein